MTLPEIAITGIVKVDIEGHKAMMFDFNRNLCYYVEPDGTDLQRFKIPEALVLAFALSLTTLATPC